MNTLTNLSVDEVRIMKNIPKTTAYFYDAVQENDLASAKLELEELTICLAKLEELKIKRERRQSLIYTVREMKKRGIKSGFARRSPFFFKDIGRVKTQDATVLMACGCVGDYRLSEKGQIVLPSPNTKGREWIKIADGPLSDMPIYFKRLKKLNKEERPFPVPMNEGGRNNTLYAHACRLVEFGYTPDEHY